MHQDHTTIASVTRQPLGRRARTTIALVATLLVALLGGLPSAGTAPLDTTAATRVVVEARDDLAAVTQAVARQGGQVLEALPFGLVVADVPAHAVDDLAADPATGGIAPDVPMRVQSADDLPAQAHGRPASLTPAAENAGEGTTVVVVDTGIAEHDEVNPVVARYDLAPGRRSQGDLHGHGTFLAGLVSDVAPGAELVSVRVADEHGDTTLAHVLRGLAMADAARTSHGADVVLLALSGPASEVPDPVMMVLEMLWARDLTVVVAAGNDQDVSSPGWDPYLITAGAVDADNVVPDWSGRGDFQGMGTDGWSKPDVVAPGVEVKGPLAPGSTIARQKTDTTAGDDHIFGSGTSMSAATTAGAAAAVLGVAPNLTPGQVKDVLKTSATSLGVDGAGAGVVDVAAAIEAAQADDVSDANEDAGLEPLPVPTPDQAPGASGRANAPTPVAPQGGPPEGTVAPQGWSWAGWSWAGWSWAGWSWASQPDTAWAGWSWADGEWAGWSWAGWSWAGWSWADAEPTGWSWAGWSWSGWSWSAHDWGAA